MRNFATLCGALAIACAPLTALANTVKVTPLGSHDGEFCLLDRAIVFEDPDGTRVLYDPGRTIAGGTDLRLGKIDAILVTHVHGDHVGDRHTVNVNAGTCDKPDGSVPAVPNSNAVGIALAKGSTIVTGSEMPPFFGQKLKAAGGDPKKSVLARFGASKSVGGVKIATVPASHSNGLAPDFVAGDLGPLLAAAGLNASVGPPTGYVLTFTNGLVAYLSGDTGITGEQDSVVRGFYRASLAVMNISDTFVTGPREAAYVIDELVRPASVIPSHANEQATKDGKVVDGTRTAQFLALVRTPAYVPLSGRTMEFDGRGRCVAGC